MIFYRRFLGDYARDTRHLKMLDHGAYTLLTDFQYAREMAIPSIEVAYRICGASTKREKKSVEFVLNEFFYLVQEGWRNKRVDEELSLANSKSESARRSANARWTRSERNANAYANASKTQCYSDSRLQTPEKEAEERQRTTAAAFAAIGFPNPIGQPAFQKIFLEEYDRREEYGWLTQVMEQTIQRCQREGVGVSPHFFEAKHIVEKEERATFENRDALAGAHREEMARSLDEQSERAQERGRFYDECLTEARRRAVDIDVITAERKRACG